MLRPFSGIARNHCLLILCVFNFTLLFWQIFNLESCLQTGEYPAKVEGDTTERCQSFSNQSPFDTSYNERVVTCSYNGSEVIFKDAVRLLGKPLTSKKFLTIGVPTVYRGGNHTHQVSYLRYTLDRVFANIESPEDVLVVLHLADRDPKKRRNLQEQLAQQFQTHIAMNRLHVIEAPDSYYPPLEGLPLNHGDSEARVRWRSKLLVDQAFLMGYCSGMGKYYLQLEDDSPPEDGPFVEKIRRCIFAKRHFDWVFLKTTYHMNIGNLFKGKDLADLARFLYMTYEEYPVDLAVFIYAEILRTKRHIDNLCGSYFLHIGKQSSLKTVKPRIA
ncbi:alpha-1,6-mannosyl-glycoprotein 4-beta-N-acetylglucosaminyltransferase [Nematostella vectensis]|uniref:alpha-1,6-mannosyl-glycoprotein 4-beta-N-acetylglucosaminyltransferase n=1 Tax=Nematostella vectensis TaxID=45351 RepID=UPI0013904273|nr:alpha-1,6-mannosyl-glycoprotein 4-beta-N-acetylglucosaminyltransferase [Nematostella vectensis]XP_048582919.1 alpha-1,6-mannosyl-glycoprotein 4-beta-N-acetylglucosaminyltransferase [Nematostella vectensis]